MYRSVKKVPVKFYAFVSKQIGIIIPIVCVLLLLATLLYQNLNTSKDIPSLPLTEMEKLEEPPTYTCCKPLNNSIRTNLFFLKTHKAGSTTVQTIILRFAVLNSLDIMNIMYHFYFLPLTDMSISPHAITPNNKYHIMAHHMRYDPKVKSYAYPNTRMVTILRHPVTLFQSIYKFFRMPETMGMSFEKFLKTPDKPKKLIAMESGYPAYRGYNQMSVDLGFDLSKSKNITAINEFVKFIDSEFDFVMISEYMDASLILLANLMGWPLEYIRYVSLNVRPPEKDAYVLTKEDKYTLMEINEVDTVLYLHFLKKFKKCMRQYGEDKLNEQVKQLKILNKQFKERCVGKEFVGDVFFGKTAIDYRPKNSSDLECVYSLQLMPTLTSLASVIQSNRIRGRGS